MTILSITILVLFVIAVWRRMHHRLVEQKFMYDVYACRDEIRKLAFNGKVDKDSWIFDYYDSSFSVAIKERYYITLFRTVVLSRRYEKDERIKEISERVEHETEKIPELKELRDKYLKIVRGYVMDQHHVTSLTLLFPVIGYLVGFKALLWCKKYIQRIREYVNGVLIYPETSLSYN